MEPERMVEIVENTFFEMQDMFWYEQYQPEVLDYIDRWYMDDFRFSIEKFGAYDGYQDWCFYYDLDPENPERCSVDIDAGLSGIYVFGLV